MKAISRTSPFIKKKKKDLEKKTLIHKNKNKNKKTLAQMIPLVNLTSFYYQNHYPWQL